MEKKTKRKAFRVTPAMDKWMKKNNISGKTIRQHLEKLKKNKIKW